MHSVESKRPWRPVISAVEGGLRHVSSCSTRLQTFGRLLVQRGDVRRLVYRDMPGGCELEGSLGHGLASNADDALVLVQLTSRIQSADAWRLACTEQLRRRGCSRWLSCRIGRVSAASRLASSGQLPGALCCIEMRAACCCRRCGGSSSATKELTAAKAVLNKLDRRLGDALESQAM
jgi:hypothetical protein